MSKQFWRYVLVFIYGLIAGFVLCYWLSWKVGILSDPRLGIFTN